MNKKRQSYIISAVLILVIIILTGLFLLNHFNQQDSEEEKEIAPTLPDNYVVNVIDGDTFEIASGEKVRLICIDAPELGKEGSSESKEFLESLILDKEVRLESDINDKDDYGRLLRYVWVNGSLDKEIFVNREIVQQGYASVFRYGDDLKRCGEIEEK